MNKNKAPQKRGALFLFSDIKIAYPIVNTKAGTSTILPK
jgi:hypothetical protein